jgi:hypothetical protein
MPQPEASIKVRPAILPDLARIATICIESLPDDPTFDYLWRYRHRFPADNHFFWLQKLKEHLFDPRYTMVVAVLYSTASAAEKNPMVTEETIISFALWERNGNTRAARKRMWKRNTGSNRLHSECYPAFPPLSLVNRRRLQLLPGAHVESCPT